MSIEQLTETKTVDSPLMTGKVSPTLSDDVVRTWSPETPAPVPLDITGGTTITTTENSMCRPLFLSPNAEVVESPHLAIWDLPSTFFHLLSFCDVRTICELMCVNQRFHQLSIDDVVWKKIIEDLDLKALLTAMDVKDQFYSFFIHQIISTAALHGHYSFSAAPPVASPMTRKVPAFNSSLRSASSLSEENGETFNIDRVFLLVSSASFGQMNHLIGRVQLLLKYQNQDLEVLQGSCRFSVYKKCFSFCCNAFSNAARGPTFSIKVVNIEKPWSNENTENFEKLKGGVRLIMTPVFHEGRNGGTQITESDVIVVNKVKSG